MNVQVGQSVFCKGHEGLFVVLNYHADSDELEIQSPSKLAPPFKVDRDDVTPISNDVLNDIRAKVISVAEEQADKGDQSRPSTPYTAEQQLEGRRRERIIKPLVLKDRITTEEKEAAMVLLKLGSTVTNDLISKYRKWPDWRSVAPGIPGRRKGSRQYDHEIEEIQQEAFDEDCTGPGATVKAFINGVRSRCLLKHKQAPSRSTLYRRYEEFSEREKIKKDKGLHAANNKFNTFPYGSITTRALEICQCDNSPLDCHAIDPKTKKVLGRPVLNIIVDDYSSSYLGFSLSFHAPSRNIVADAFFMAIKPKYELLKEFGLAGQYEWIQYGVPERYRVDGGGDLNAITVLAALDNAGIVSERRLRPQSGGKVERAIGKINRSFMQRLNGAIASARKMAYREDPESLAEYSITDLFILIITEICIWHETPGADGLTPNQRWSESFGLKDGIIRTPRTLKDPLQFKIEMLHEVNPLVRAEGIKHTELVYFPGPYKDKVNTRVRLKLDYEDLHQAWVEHDGQWVRVELKNKNKFPRTMREFRANKKSGLPVGRVTDKGLGYINKQRDLRSSLISERDRRREEESRELSNRVSGACRSADSQSHTPSEIPARSPTGSAPPMMGDDDL